jgi:hypothetical protein
MDHRPLPSHSIQAFPKRVDSLLNDKEKGEANAKDIISVADIFATLEKYKQIKESKTTSHFRRKPARLQEKIEQLTEHQRKIFLGTFLTKDKQQTWTSPTISYEEENKLFKEAFAACNKTLVAAGLDEWDDKKAQVRVALEYGSDKSENISKLIAISEGGERSIIFSSWTVSKKVFELALKMNPTELFRLRKDATILANLRKQTLEAIDQAQERLDQAQERAQLGVILDETKYWNRFIELLQLPQRYALSEKNEPKWKNVATKEKEKGREEALSTGSIAEVAEKQQDFIELNPAYWATHLEKELDKLWVDKDLIYSLTQRAQLAAQRSEKHLDKIKEAKPEAPAPNPILYLSEKEFLKGILTELGKLGEKFPKKLKSKVAEAYAAFESGQPITTDLRLAHAAGNFKPTASAIIAAFEDLSGKALLVEWSNFEEFTELTKQRDKLKAQAHEDSSRMEGLSKEEQELEVQIKAAQNKPNADTQKQLLDKRKDLDKKKEALQSLLEMSNLKLGNAKEALSHFMPGIRGERLKYLEAQNLGTAKRVEIIKQLSKKIHQAMLTDKDFQEAMAEQGISNDEEMQARVKFPALIMEQEMKDTGLQFSALSQTSQARKEARNIYKGRFVSLHTDIHQVEESEKDGEASEAKIKQLKGRFGVESGKDEQKLAEKTAAFDKMRSRIASISRTIIGSVIAAIVAAAGIAITALTGGAAAPVVAPAIVLLIKGLVAAAGAFTAMGAKNLLDRLIQGDAYSKRQLLTDIVTTTIKQGITLGLDQFFAGIDASWFAPDGTLLKDVPPDLAPYVTQENLETVRSKLIKLSSGIYTRVATDAINKEKFLQNSVNNIGRAATPYVELLVTNGLAPVAQIVATTEYKEYNEVIKAGSPA